VSTYQHSTHKFADTGLQLRLPVDLVPDTQYSELTNALPRIEGEVVAREGMATVVRLFQVAAVSVLSRTNTTVSVASIATTIYPHGFNIGDAVSIVVTGSSPTGVSFISVGGYGVTVTSVPDPFTFNFSLGIPGIWNATDIGVNVFAQATNASQSTNLVNRLVNTLFRLNQAQPSISGNRLAGMQGRLYRASLPGGNVFTELVHPSITAEPPSVSNGFSGNPMAIISFRFTLDTVSWAIIADQSVMYKFREDASGNPLFFLLGNPFPTVPAQASAGAAGNLDSTGGALYDWRYTYYDGYVQTEGNPSPGTDAAVVDIQLSSTHTTPVNTVNAFTGVTNTSGTGTSSQADATPFHDVSCRWAGFSNPAGTPFEITLNVTWQVDIVKTNIAPVQAQFYYSLNGGTTTTTFSVVTNVSSGTINPQVVLPLGTDLTQVLVGVYAFCNPDSVTLGTGNSVLVTVLNIEIDCAHTPVSGAIAVVNQRANVLVATPTQNDGRITAIRLYRRGGSLPDAWRLVGTYNLSGLPVASINKLTGAGANDGNFIGGAIAWTNPNNVTSAVLFATVAITTMNVSKWLDATNFGYTIVGGQPIRGIVVTMVFKGSVATDSFIVVTLLKAGVPVGTWDGFIGGAPPGSVKTSSGITMPTGNTTFTFGGASDTWGTTWTAADINAVNFGVRFLIWDRSGTVCTFSVNNVNINVYTDEVQLVDNVSDVQLSTQPLLQFDNDQPVTSTNAVTNQPLNFIWGPVGIDARVLGCGDPGRPECVYYSKPGNPDAWPPENFLEVSDPGTPIIAGCVYNTRNYAFSREAVFELIEGLGTGSTFTPFKTPSAHGLYTPWGLALGPSIYFIAKDGIYQTTGGQEASLVENDIKPIFPTYDGPGQQAGIYESVDYSDPNLLRLAYHNDEIWFLYKGGQSGTAQVLVYDILKKRWRAVDYGSNKMGVFYSEPGTISSLLAGTASGELVQSGGDVDPDNTAILVQMQTGAHDLGMPLNRKQFGNVIFDIDPDNADALHPIKIFPIVDGGNIKPQLSVTGGVGRQQFPLDLSDFFGFNLEFLITWQKYNGGGPVGIVNPILYQYDILYFPEPVGVKHWESQPSSMGVQGFMHVRDMYVAIRSTADVTMTMVFDVGNGTEVTQTYTIPSTGNDRLKAYVQLDSNKGLLYRWSLDSTEEFRVYVEDCETRVKGWLTVLGYAIMKPFGAEVAA
jgi:hypothetical protein